MSDNRRNWSQFEDKSIASLVKRLGCKNWALISEKMSSKHGIDGRTGKQCRERWHNHLNPDIQMAPWTEEEEKLMFDAHREHGNRWIQIAKLYKGRTENSIKNHYFSTVRKGLRHMSKILGYKKSTNMIRTIKPADLSQFHSGNSRGYSDNELKQISQLLFFFSRNQNKSKDKKIDIDEREKLQAIIDKILKSKQADNEELIKETNPTKVGELQHECKIEHQEDSQELGQGKEDRKEEIKEPKRRVVTRVNRKQVKNDSNFQGHIEPEKPQRKIPQKKKRVTKQENSAQVKSKINLLELSNYNSGFVCDIPFEQINEPSFQGESKQCSEYSNRNMYVSLFQPSPCYFPLTSPSRMTPTGDIFHAFNNSIPPKLKESNQDYQQMLNNMRKEISSNRNNSERGN